ncbi:MAG: YceD family protein [Gammaproteobacteria bacterium]
MLDKLPDEVEPLGLALAGRSFKGDIGLSDMQRLSVALASDSVLAVQAVFEVDQCRLPVMRLVVTGQVLLVCQRCMDALPHALDLRPVLAIVADEERADVLPEGYDPLIATGKPVRLSELIEDEIMLALPLIAKHLDESVCDVFIRQKEAAEKVLNPFGVLEQLKRNK